MSEALSQEKEQNLMLKPILISRDEPSEDCDPSELSGCDSIKSKKRVTFNRVVEYITYSENLSSLKRRLLRDDDLRKGMPKDLETKKTAEPQ